MPHPLSINSDFVSDILPPPRYLRAAKKQGFTHIHWCHHWCDDYFYSDGEIDEIRGHLASAGLILSDCHASAGKNANWSSLSEEERKKGVELIRNRVDLTSRLDGDAIVLHSWWNDQDAAEVMKRIDRLKKSLAELEDYCRVRKIKIALENSFQGDASFDIIEELFRDFDFGYLGFCWDTGHSNLTEGTINRADKIKDRLCVLHVHDNNGKSDQHRIPFSGTVDWKRAVEIIAASPYDKPFSLELMKDRRRYIRSSSFLKDAFRIGQQLASEIEQLREEK